MAYDSYVLQDIIVAHNAFKTGQFSTRMLNIRSLLSHHDGVESAAHLLSYDLDHEVV